MAVNALELRPRTPVALFDAALRLTGRLGGLWALTLPAGALVTGASIHLYDAMVQKESLFLPSLLFTLAWFVRAVFQGAACHFVDRTLLAAEPPSPASSLRAALRRLPSLFITASVLALFQLVSLPLTLGISFFFYGSHLVAYAAAMQGLGSPLLVLKSGSTLLGPAKKSAVRIRSIFLAQAVLWLNLHLTTKLLLLGGSDLLGMDLAFADRFASLDNGAWWVVLLSLGFTLTEPLRATVAVLLLTDGRVRQEGLDLLSQIEQLPRRTQRKPLRSGGALLLLALLAAVPARAETLPLPEIERRLKAIPLECKEDDPLIQKQLSTVHELGTREQSSLSRFLQEVESTAYDDGDCELAMTQLSRGAKLIAETHEALAKHDPPSAAKRAEEILARPEFRNVPKSDPASPTQPPEEKAPSGFWDWLGKRWSDFWEAIAEWLRKLGDEEDHKPQRNLPIDAGAGAGVANALVVILVTVVIGVLAWLLLRGRRSEAEGEAAFISSAREEPTSEHEENALSRPPEGWAHLADELAARGQFREAVRSLYLALLARLHHDGHIDYDPALSNWDYLRTFKGDADRKKGLRELTLRFDFTYYGNLGADAEGYAAFRALTAPFLATRLQEAAGA